MYKYFFKRFIDILFSEWTEKVSLHVIYYLQNKKSREPFKTPLKKRKVIAMLKKLIAMFRKNRESFRPNEPEKHVQMNLPLDF